MRFAILRSGIAVLLLGAALAAQAVVLYDAASDTTPSQQGWATSGFGYTESVGGGVYSFSSSVLGNAPAAGSARTAPFALDTQTGFQLDFSLRVLSETHAADNQRAGFSIIFTGHDPARALELAFWTDRVWAYDYNAAAPNPFVPGPGKDHDTTAWTQYRLSVANQQFTLSAAGSTLFSGTLQDYSAQGWPYNQQDFLFFGDDTSRASASVQLGAISLTPVPEPASAALLALGMALAGVCTRSRARHA